MSKKDIYYGMDKDVFDTIKKYADTLQRYVNAKTYLIYSEIFILIFSMILLGFLFKNLVGFAKTIF